MTSKVRVRKTAYKARDGARISDAEAAIVGGFCERLVKKYGIVTAQHFVAEAKRDRQVRPLLDWDDRTAAESWRLHRARILMGSYTVVVERDDREVVVRGMQFVDECGGYVPARTILSNEAMSEHVVAKAKREVVAWFHRYRNLQSFAGIGPVLDAVERNLADVETEVAVEEEAVAPSARKVRRSA